MGITSWAHGGDGSWRGEWSGMSVCETANDLWQHGYHRICDEMRTRSRERTNERSTTSRTTTAFGGPSPTTPHSTLSTHLLLSLFSSHHSTTQPAQPHHVLHPPYPPPTSDMPPPRVTLFTRARLYSLRHCQVHHSESEPQGQRAIRSTFKHTYITHSTRHVGSTVLMLDRSSAPPGVWYVLACPLVRSTRCRTRRWTYLSLPTATGWPLTQTTSQ